MALRASARLRIGALSTRPGVARATPAVVRVAARAFAAAQPAATMAAPTPVPAPAAASGASAAQYLTTELREGGVLLVRLDAAGEKVNTLSEAAMAAFEGVLARLEGDAAVRAAVIISGKPDNFVAGADIGMLERCTSAEQLTALAKGGAALFNRLAAARKPVVAAINGSCLGGGLELALACSYRIASSGPKTRLGLPEVQLGLLPGAGGTQRLPRLIGIQAAVEAMTTGKQLKPDRARKAGLVDEVVDPSALERVAVTAARELADGTLARAPRKQGWMTWLLEGNQLGRSVLFDQASKAVAKATGGHYPAPPAILEAVRAGVEQGLPAGLEKEASLFGSLGMSRQSAALRGLFFAQTATKKNPFKGSGSREVATVGVLGAGLMGAGISQVTASAGLHVVMKDRDAAAVARGTGQIADSLAGRLKKRQVTAFERDVTLSRIAGVSDADAAWPKHVGRCDVVVEAVPEVLALKHTVIKQIEPLLRPDAVIATNTSALPIGSIASAASRPERVLGMHYFSPVDKMPLLEVIPHAGTAPGALAAAFDLGLRQGKTVIVVKDVPGFYVNRSLAPWADEALLLVQGGMAPDVLDAAVRAFGYPVGPVALADEVGVDVLYHTASTIAPSLGPDRMAGAAGSAPWLKAMVDAKMLGKKAGRGFYVHDGGGGDKGKKAGGPLAAVTALLSGGGGGGKSRAKPVNQAALALLAPYRTAAEAATTPAAAVERMVLRFVKECIHSLEDGVIRSPGDGDVGAVFGLGFPPFLGGPFRYADGLGARSLADTMAAYADALGPRFAPPQALLDLAKSGGSFHGGAGKRA